MSGGGSNDFAARVCASPDLDSEDLDSEDSANGVRIVGIATAVGEHAVDAGQFLEFQREVLHHRDFPEDERRRALGLLERIVPASGIDQRYSVIPDFSSGSRELFGSGFNPTTAPRMKLYQKYSVGLAESSIRKVLQRAEWGPEEVTHLVVCTCTGFFAPGPDVELCRRLGLRSSISRLQVGFMGCFAGFNGLRVAAQICRADPRARVVVVAVELCSLHFQATTRADLLVSNALFGDAAAAVAMSSTPVPQGETSLRMLHSQSLLIPQSQEEMSWRIGDHGFRMSLSTAVPRLLRDHAEEFIDGLLDANNLSRREPHNWAVHPGGRQILDYLERSISRDCDLTISRSVLREFGNVSSATIYFVMERWMAQLEPGESLVALGFGPGISIEGALLCSP